MKGFQMKSIKYIALAYLLAGTMSIQAMNKYSVKRYHDTPISFETILDKIDENNPIIANPRKSQKLNSDVSKAVPPSASSVCKEAINNKLKELFTKDLQSISTTIDTLLEKNEFINCNVSYRFYLDSDLHFHTLKGQKSAVVKAAIFLQYYTEIGKYNDGYWPNHILDLFKKHVRDACYITDLHYLNIKKALHKIDFECTPGKIMPVVKQIIHEKTGKECNFLGDEYFPDSTIMYSACQMCKPDLITKKALKILNHQTDTKEPYSSN